MRGSRGPWQATRARSEQARGTGLISDTVGETTPAAVEIDEAQ